MIACPRSPADNRRCIRLAAILLFVAWGGGAAFAQDFVLNEQQFDSWLLSGAGVNIQHGTGYRDYLSQQAKFQIMLADRATGLSDEQKAKLELAARGDTMLFVEEVERVRQRLVGTSWPNNNINEPYQQIQPLSAQLSQGLHGSDSLLQKVLHHVLTPEQLESMEQAEAERRRRKHEAAAGMLIAGIQRTTPMTAEQRDAFLELIMENTKPAKKASRYERYVILYHLSSVPRRELTEIFDTAQMKSIEPAIRRGKAYEAMLRQQGVLDE